MQSPSHERSLVALAEIVTVGLPFCVFKLLTGLVLVSTAVAPIGYALLVLGAVDAVLNAVNLVGLVVAQRRISAVCTAELALRGELGLAIDVFLAFSLVAIVIACGLLARMAAWALPIWNIAVVLNVIGAGVGRLVGALRLRG